MKRIRGDREGIVGIILLGLLVIVILIVVGVAIIGWALPAILILAGLYFLFKNRILVGIIAMAVGVLIFVL